MTFHRIRSGRGLGDALYLQAIVRHLVARGERLEVCTDYPELYRFGDRVRFAPFSRQVRYTAHYMQAKHDERTHQFADMCRSAGIRRQVALKLDWTVQNPALIERVRDAAGSRPILLVHGGREAFGRADGYGLELLPDAAVFNGTVAALRRDFFTVYVGRGARLYDVPVDLDLHDATGVTDTIDLGLISDACVAQCSFVIPLAESFDKPLLIVFAAKGMASAKPAVRTITPKKVLSKPSSTYVIDNWEPARLDAAVREFRNLAAGDRAVPGQASGAGRQRAERTAQ